jgi:hypothetical protein
VIVERRIDPSPLVEDPHDRQLFDARLALHTDQLVAPRLQPTRRPAPQLVEMIGDVEHAPIKSWGYDSCLALPLLPTVVLVSVGGCTRLASLAAVRTVVVGEPWICARRSFSRSRRAPSAVS